METETTKLIPLGAMASLIRVPATWLKQEAIAGRVPALNANGRLLFNRAVVERLLLERAAQTAGAA